MLLYDYHTHTNYSPDSSMPLRTLIKRCATQGLKEICITDHIDNYLCYDYDVPDYNKVSAELEEIAKDFPEINVKLGCELSFSPTLYKEFENVAKSFDFDFIIGSSHECDGSFLYPGTDYFNKKEKYQAFKIYYEEVLENIKSVDNFDVYGHIDYIYRYSKNHYKDNEMNYSDFKDLIDESLKTLIYKGKGIELNTSGIRYGLNDIHPNDIILKRYKELGGEIITVGSDAHAPDHVYRGFDLAYERLIDAGFEYITTFDKRKPSFIKIK